MPTKIEREDFLHCLESVTPGLSPKAIIEQSNCFVFRNGWVITYNDEICCRSVTPLDKTVTGVVKAEKFLELIRKLPDDYLYVEASESELLVAGHNKKKDAPGDRKSGVRMEATIELPLDKVDKPDAWTPLHADFSEAVKTVQYSAGTDQSTVAVFIHIHPDWVEATDDVQICRWRLKTGFPESTLVRQSSIKHITALGLNKFCCTKSWAHFRNAKMIFSCRLYVGEKFPSLDAILDQQVSMTDITFPKNLTQETELADIFSSENTDGNSIKVELKSSGRVQVRGDGISGWLEGKSQPIKYDGKSTAFRISPQLLSELISNYDSCKIASDRLRVEGKLTSKGVPRFVYLTRIEVPENGEAEATPRKKAKA